LALPHTPISACLVDISDEGVGALFYRADRKEPVIQPGLAVQVGLRLPNVQLPLILSGVVNRSQQIGNSTMTSIGIQFTPNEKHASQLRSYIRTRQAEILDELSNSMNLVMESIQTKDLYF
jgi:hypothetical protein